MQRRTCAGSEPLAARLQRWQASTCCATKTCCAQSLRAQRKVLCCLLGKGLEPMAIAKEALKSLGRQSLLQALCGEGAQNLQAENAAFSAHLRDCKDLLKSVKGWLLHWESVEFRPKCVERESSNSQSTLKPCRPFAQSELTTMDAVHKLLSNCKRWAKKLSASSSWKWTWCKAERDEPQASEQRKQSLRCGNGDDYDGRGDVDSAVLARRSPSLSFSWILFTQTCS